MRLEKAYVSFGINNSYGEAAKMVEEHYGVVAGKSAVRNTTTKHAQKALSLKAAIFDEYKAQPNAATIIGEVDGVMCPIVDIDPEAPDRRKNKVYHWREGRLTLAYPDGTVDPFYDASFGTAPEVGNQLARCVRVVGCGPNTEIRIIADGAKWIDEEVERIFGCRAKFLLDFYHVSEYLAKAAQCCSSDDPKGWLHRMQSHMKDNETSVVFHWLVEHINDSNLEEHDCQAKVCYNYLEKRQHQLDYKSALDQDLPIGSGRIESGNRSVIQRRLKLPGAWWLIENATGMLAFRVLRANGLLDYYWDKVKAPESEFLYN